MNVLETLKLYEANLFWINWNYYWNFFFYKSKLIQIIFFQLMIELPLFHLVWLIKRLEWYKMKKFYCLISPIVPLHSLSPTALIFLRIEICANNCVWTYNKFGFTYLYKHESIKKARHYMHTCKNICLCKALKVLLMKFLVIWHKNIVNECCFTISTPSCCKNC